MVDFLREIVSGKKNRYTKGGYNLDLTYITDRIIAMSFPSAGLESMYRNNIDDVAKLLETNHGTNYMIVNLSGRKYNYEKFRNNVFDFPWEDHHSPPLELLFQACECIHLYLQRHKDNVAVIHCVAGKGRTGTMICCYLLYSGRFNTRQEALKYYKEQRFQSGGGVTQPSQVRYIKYFEEILKGYIDHHIIYQPVVVEIQCLILFGIPWIAPGYFTPLAEVYSVRDNQLRYSVQRSERIPYHHAEENPKITIKFADKKPLVMTGDILIKVYHVGAWSNQLAFRFGFNTTFLTKLKDSTTVLELSLYELDPDSVKTNDKFPNDFKIQLHMKILNEDPNDYWFRKENEHFQAIYEVLKNYKHPEKTEASQLLFKEEKSDDVDEVLSHKDVAEKKKEQPNSGHRVPQNHGESNDSQPAEMKDINEEKLWA